MPVNASRGSRSVLESDSLLLCINAVMHVTGLLIDDLPFDG